MQTFEYEASDASGQTVRGSIDATSQGEAAQRLAAQGLAVVSLTAVSNGPGGLAGHRSSGRRSGILSRLANMFSGGGTGAGAGPRSNPMSGRSPSPAPGGSQPGPRPHVSTSNFTGRAPGRLAALAASMAARVSVAGTGTSVATGAGAGIGAATAEALRQVSPAFRKASDEGRKLADSFQDVRRKIGWLREGNPSTGSLASRLQALSRDPLIFRGQRDQAANALSQLRRVTALAGRYGRQAGQARRQAASLAERATKARAAFGEARKRSDALQAKFRTAAQEARAAFTHQARQRKLYDAAQHAFRAARANSGTSAGGMKTAHRNLQQARSNLTAAIRNRQRASKAATGANQRYRTALGQTANRQRRAATAGASAARARQRYQAVRSRARQFGQAAHQARKNATQLARGLTAQSAATAGMLAVGRAAGLAGGALLTLGQATISAVRGLSRFADSVNESNRHLASYNGGIAYAFARLNVGDLRRNIRMGQMTEGTATKLADSINRMRDSWMTFDKSTRNMQNVFATAAAEISGRIGKKLGGFAEIAERVVTDRNVQTKVERIAEQGLRFAFPLEAAIWDNWDKLMDRINKFLDDWGIQKLKPAPQGLPGGWDDFIMACRDGRFGAPANAPAGRINGNGQAVLGGQGWANNMPWQGRRQGPGINPGQRRRGVRPA